MSIKEALKCAILESQSLIFEAIEEFAFTTGSIWNDISDETADSLTNDSK